MSNPQSTTNRDFIDNILGFGVAVIAGFITMKLGIYAINYLSSNTEIDRKLVSICLEKIEQGLKTSGLSIAAQKTLILEGVDCLKSVPNQKIEKK